MREQQSATTEQRRQYVAIDLKSFYASVECQERGLDPLTTNLVVADVSRTEKTICLAVSPSLKTYGLPGRTRLFEVQQKVREINAARRAAIHGRPFRGSSWDNEALKRDPSLALDFIAATPQMALYMQKSTDIYHIYLDYIAPEDMHVYSIDEVFMDVTSYLHSYGMTAHELARKIIRDIHDKTGITATAGIGTNLYLAKVAMDIVAKHMPADEDGVRIAELDELSYRRKLWTHRPLTDFWRVGRGITRKLEQNGMFTMGDIARCSVERSRGYDGEDLLYHLFGVNAEYLIDHAWGWEPVTIADIRTYKPENCSLSQGQVLASPYSQEKAGLVVREMTDQLVLDMVDKRVRADSIVLAIGYDRSSLADPERRRGYQGAVSTDRYGREVPKEAGGQVKLGRGPHTSREIAEAVMKVYRRITDPALLVRRITIAAEHVIPEEMADQAEEPYTQLDLFTDFAAEEQKKQQQEEAARKDRRMLEAALAIQKRYGKNAILKGRDLEEGATTRQRNGQIGGHRA